MATDLLGWGSWKWGSLSTPRGPCIACNARPTREKGLHCSWPLKWPRSERQKALT